MQFLRQSTACTVMFGPFVDKADGVTEKNDATCITDIDHASTGIKLSKAGGTAAVRHATVTASVADANGMMKVALDTTDTNTIGTLDMLFSKAATYLPVHKEFTVLDEAVYDWFFGTNAPITPGTGTGQLSVTSGGAALAADQAVNATKIGGQAVTASGGITFPAATLASTTNITAAAGCSLATDQAVNVTKWGGTAIASAYVQANTAQWGGAALPTQFGCNNFPTWSGVTIGTVTTLTNAPPDSSGVTEILTRLPDATAGATGGLLIAGSNAATTFASITLSSGTVPVDVQTIKTQTVTCSAGVTIPASIANEATLTAIKGATWSGTTDTLEAIRDKLPANLEDLSVTDTTGLVRPDMANASGNYSGTVATVTTLTNAPADSASITSIKAVTDKLDTTVELIP